MNGLTFWISAASAILTIIAFAVLVLALCMSARQGDEMETRAMLRDERACQARVRPHSGMVTHLGGERGDAEEWRRVHDWANREA